jgi:DNA polymerase III alpha subunit
MLFEYALLNQLTDKERMAVQDCGKSLEDTLKFMLSFPSGRDKPISSEKRKLVVAGLLKSIENPPHSLQDNPEWIASVEESLLGISMTCSKVDACDTSSANMTCKDFLNSNTRNGIIIAVELQEVKEILTKKEDKMAFVKLSDITGIIDNGVVFPDAYRMYKDLLIEGNTLLVCGERGKEKNSLIVQKFHQI